MDKLQRALYELDAMERVPPSGTLLHRLDARAKLLVTLAFLVVVLFIPPAHLARLILSFTYPVAVCAIGGLRYGTVLRRSLCVLPFLLLIGAFNPLTDHRTAFRVECVTVSAGWVSFAAIVLRGVVSVQAVLVLIGGTGFHTLCRALRRMGVPSVLATQLLLVYRYIGVLLQEALAMQRARTARSFGRTSYPPKMWGAFIGQLLMRTVARAEHIHSAMLARGFTGQMANTLHTPWRWRDTVYLLIWCAVFTVILFFPLQT